MLRPRFRSTLLGARPALPQSNLGPRTLPRLLQQPLHSAAAQPASQPPREKSYKTKRLFPTQGGEIGQQSENVKTANKRQYVVPWHRRSGLFTAQHNPDETVAHPIRLTGVTRTSANTIVLSCKDKNKPFEAPALWFRDKCACPRCVDPDSGQKNFSTTDIADAPEVASVGLTESGGLRILWKNDAPSGDALHETTFGADEVRGWMMGLGSTTPTYLPVQRTLWNRDKYEKLYGPGLSRVAYKDWVKNDEAFWKAFEVLAKTGLICVTRVPESESAVETIAERVGEIQHTFYGRTWDVRSKPHAENVAYTSVFLGLHQDLMYHKPIPRLQFLHCLANSCEGGESLFSDGVRAAYEMYQFSRDNYKVLERHNVEFHYDKNGHYYHSPRHVIQRHTPLDRIECTHWAPPFQAPFTQARFSDELLQQPFTISEWKRAATEFQQNIEAPENLVEVKLQPGECVIFDNLRVLHGRRAFAAGTGFRWLKGTYVSGQVFEAKEREFQRKFGNGLPAVAELRSSLAKAERRQVEELRKVAEKPDEEQGGEGGAPS